MTAPPLDPSGADQRLRLVYCAMPDAPTADRLGELAVRKKLAACANSWPIRSVYWWEGSVEQANEVAVLFKTSPKKLGALFRFLAREHPYAVPDILELKVTRVHEPYIRWLFGAIDPGSREPAVARGRTQIRRAGSPRGRAAPSRQRTRARRRLR